MILSFLFIALASICNAIMDVIDHHYYISIFNKSTIKSMQYWNPSDSWRNKYINRDASQGRKRFLKFKKFKGFKVHPSFTDEWHLMKSLMSIFLCLSISCYSGGFSIINFILLGTTWNMVFSLFYARLLRK